MGQKRQTGLPARHFRSSPIFGHVREPCILSRRATRGHVDALRDRTQREQSRDRPRRYGHERVRGMLIAHLGGNGPHRSIGKPDLVEHGTLRHCCVAMGHLGSGLLWSFSNLGREQLRCRLTSVSRHRRIRSSSLKKLNSGGCLPQRPWRPRLSLRRPAAAHRAQGMQNYLRRAI